MIQIRATLALYSLFSVTSTNVINYVIDHISYSMFGYRKWKTKVLGWSLSCNFSYLFMSCHNRILDIITCQIPEEGKKQYPRSIRLEDGTSLRNGRDGGGMPNYMA